ncbi:nucleotidyltransferase [Streptomyces albidoflavus]|uniref:nucleotidyltransferase domain-containing protein n=1 Tax=Streptomyces albidoflavus TaxID=1886 RepID=UPI000BB66406|nr:nucleotidyltransferase [Streptomyces albidoflavus]PAX86719.1 nucleotidyltransferase [Streptomyces albidoflavus]PBO22066.1 nucleotidyltransferase [Streptomyces albidoflavus]PBO28034.1 nucleotidyltransferase [Streptomyces albidoflavus]
MARQLTYDQRIALINKWKSPPGASEQLRLERAERMVKEAVARHEPFQGFDITVASKGSYPNNTNVRGDSDVDIMVKLNDPFHTEGLAAWWFGQQPRYTGPWTQRKLRQEVEDALTNHFGSVDTDHNLALYVPEVVGSRPSIDVVPCFKWVAYDSMAPGGEYVGSVVYGRNGKRVINWPEFQLANGRTKNANTKYRYKFAVRVLKNVENVLASEGVITALPSYFSECLIYNVPDHVMLGVDSLDEVVRESLREVYRQLTGAWFSSQRMVEPNGIKKVFGEGQKWTEKDARELIEGAWYYLNYEG